MIRRAWLLLAACAWAQEPAVQFDVKTPLRDGVRLSANVFRPAAAGRFPVLLLRTPYGKSAALTAGQQFLVRHGYAFVAQDVRGRGASEGVFRPLTQETPDGADTLDWIARQPWCDGSIGMVGGSYSGIAQWRAALANHPALKAIFPVVSGWDDYTDRFYSPGGALKLAHRLEWLAENLRLPGFAAPELRRMVEHLPLRTADRAATGQTIGFYQQALDHPAYDDFWRALSTRAQIARVRVPVFIVGGWYDNYAESDLAAFAALQGLGHRVRCAIGPWGHNMSTDMPGSGFGRESRLNVTALQLEWFDTWLKRTRPPDTAPALRYFLMGANRWQDAPSWPPPDVRQTPLYLAPQAALHGEPPRRGAADSFDYDPRRPVPTLGGAVCCNYKLLPWGPLDQRPAERRRDVLLYTSAPLGAAVTVIGPVAAVLYVASTAPDTDFTAKLTDVAPSGESRLLCDGILRLRYRRGTAQPAAYAPGAVERIVVPLGVTAHVFAAGHRIRLAVSSSNFPRFDRNPNTGRPVAGETVLKPARQNVYHGRAHASHLLLPLAAAPGGFPVKFK